MEFVKIEDFPKILNCYFLLVMGKVYCSYLSNKDCGNFCTNEWLVPTD